LDFAFLTVFAQNGGQEYLLFFIILASLIVLILNLTNITISSNINIGISAIIITIISTFFIMALFRFNHINYYKFHIVKTLTTIFWCFVGIEAMSHISHEFKKENDFFKAVVIGIIVVAFLYMAVTLSLLVFNAYGNENKNLHSLIVATSYIMPYTNKILAIIAFVICIMALNLYVASLTRLSITLNIKFKTALFIIMGIILIVSVLKFLYDLKIDFLISYSNGVFVLIYFLVSLSALKILKSKTALLAVISMGAIIALLKADMLYALIMLGVFLLSKKLKNFKFSQ
jgi:amino acid efflux transporter